MEPALLFFIAVILLTAARARVHRYPASPAVVAETTHGGARALQQRMAALPAVIADLGRWV